MGIIYYRWTATCLLEFQAAYRRRDLPRSIFTFQLQLNRHDKRTSQRGQPWPRFIFMRPPRRPDGLDLMQKVPDTVAEGAWRQGAGGEGGE